MHEDAIRAVEAGATVITASRRLSRALTQAFHSRQQEQGRSVWKTPDILPLDAFLARAWRDYILRGTRQEPCPTLLSAFQEQIVWEQVIRESPAGDSLLRIPETARLSMEAWQLVRSYRLPVDGRFEASADWAAFAAWSRAFAKHCQARNWLDAARLPDVVAELLKTGQVPPPLKLYLAGFHELTPQQTDLLAALGEWREWETPNFESAPQCWRLRDSTEEIRTAAAWARRLLEQNGETQIAVIVPNLASLRARVERIFRETLDPGAQFDDQERSFHVSLGPALDEYPVVRAAALMLEFATGALALPQAGMLLRSPFLDGARAEWTMRAQLDAKLRKHGVWDVALPWLRDEAGSCPLLQRALQRFVERSQQLPAERTSSEWSRDFSRLLEALGWPGDRSLSSREYQVLEAWHGLLSNLAALDVAAPPMNFAEAFSRLRELAAASPFQVENEGAPVQIMGMLEASGLRFDHLWVMGLHDEALPAVARPNPFLPNSLQREHQLPHSSAEREFEFAKKLMERLRASARDLVCSYPETEGDRRLSPSPLVAAESWLAPGERALPSEWVWKMREAVQIEELHDETAPAIAAESMQPGGTSLFKDIAACPFRAFAKHRLGAKPLEETDLGPSYGDRGSEVHKALELIWRELGSQARLLELKREELRELVARSVRVALRHAGIGRELEQRRLENLLADWLEIEKSREPFIVRKREEERIVGIGGLHVKTRVDRIDELAGERELILDYKTGQLKGSGWEGDRPDEPQLPLYCATSERPIAGAAFALIRADEMRFRGMAEDGVSLPAMIKMRVESPASFGGQVENWKRVLERLAGNFRAGCADVDPKPGACEHCGLRALCRIREFENDVG